MLLRTAIDAFIKERIEEDEWEESTVDTARSTLQTFHKLILGISCGKNAKEPDGRVSHTAYKEMKDAFDTHEITREHVVVFINYFQEKRIASRAKAKVQLQTFFDWMLDNDLMSMPTNVVRKFKNPIKGKTPNEIREDRVRYTDEQIKHLLMVTLEEFGALRYYLIFIMILTERRVGEVARLRWNDIDLDNWKMTFWNEKGDRPGRYYFNPEAVQIFSAYREWYQARCDEQGLGAIEQNGQWYVFPNVTFMGSVRYATKRPWKIDPHRRKPKESMGVWFRESLQAAGLYKPGQVCHIARHHMINLQIDTFDENGFTDSEKIASTGSNHRSSETIRKNYRDMTKEEKAYRDAVRGLEWFNPTFREGLPGFEEYNGPSGPKRIPRAEPEPVVEEPMRQRLRLVQ